MLTPEIDAALKEIEDFCPCCDYHLEIVTEGVADANAEALLAMISKPRFEVDEAAIRDRMAQFVPVAIVYDNCPISAERFAAMLNEEAEG